MTFRFRRAVGRSRGSVRTPTPTFRVISDAMKTRPARIGAAISLIVVALAALGPVIAPYSPTEIVGGPFGSPDASSWLGTDVLGRDVLSRFLMGGRAILLMAAGATAIGMGIGISAGLIAAYSKGWVDEWIMRGLDVILSFPQLVLGLLFVSIAGPKLWLITLVIGVSHVPRVARIVRASSIGVVEEDFVLLAETWGASRTRILFTEVLPNLSGPVLVELGLRFIFSISLVSGMNFLGFGVQPPHADWGVMVNENRPGLSYAPLGVLVPIVAIALLSVGINFVTDSIARSARGDLASTVKSANTKEATE